MKYPEKSNWISWKRLDENKYILLNHLLEEVYELTADDISFIEKMDGKTNPYKVLKNEYGMTGDTAREYIEFLQDNMILRVGNSLDRYGLHGMLTLIKVYHSERLKPFAQIYLTALLVALVPMCVLGGRSLANLDMYDFYDENVWGIWAGIILGTILGIIFHELSHAMSSITFNGKVMEFGIGFHGFPSAYTLMDTKMISSRLVMIVTDLAGVISNIILCCLSLWLCNKVSGFGLLFEFMAVVNAELSIVNLLFVEGLDGMGAISQILGKEDILEYFKKLLKVNGSGQRKTGDFSEIGKVFLTNAYIFKVSKIIYPVLILFNICLVLRW